MDELEEKYISEPDPGLRETILEQLSAEQGNTELNKLRRRLLGARFLVNRADGSQIDRSMRAFTRLSFYRKRQPSRLLGRKQEDRDFQSIAEDLQSSLLDDVDAYQCAHDIRAAGEGEVLQKADQSVPTEGLTELAVRQEIRNAILRYRSISESDPRYGSVAGFILATGDAKTQRIREDLRELCIDIPARYGHSNERIFVLLREEAEAVLQDD